MLTEAYIEALLVDAVAVVADFIASNSDLSDDE